MDGATAGAEAKIMDKGGAGLGVGAKKNFGSATLI